LADLGVNSWFNIVNIIFEFGGIEADEIEYCDLTTKFKDIFIERWKLERDDFCVNGKLGVLASIKNEFVISSYLTSNICSAYKRAIAKIRLSAHKLPIETERYMKIPRAERVCTLGCEALGDEMHYLFDCKHPAMEKVYAPIVVNVDNQLPDFGKLNSKEKFKVLLNNDEPCILSLMGKLCLKVMDRFSDITW